MKTRFPLFNGLVILFLVLTSFIEIPVLHAQDTLVIIAVYDGHEDYGYNFIATRDDDEEYTITFQEVNEEVLRTFDLNSEALVNKKFKITYIIDIVVTIDDNEIKDEEEVNTIVKLEKL